MEADHSPSAPQLTGRPPQFYLPNYRMGKTLGIGSFGKARGGGVPHRLPASSPNEGAWARTGRCAGAARLRSALLCGALQPDEPQGAVAEVVGRPQVKMAEHALTGHKVAIKILNRKKIKAMDMDEKGAQKGAPRQGAPCFVSTWPC